MNSVSDRRPDRRVSVGSVLADLFRRVSCGHGRRPWRCPACRAVFEGRRS